MVRQRTYASLVVLVAAVTMLAAFARPVHALSVELTDVASDRIERQRAYSARTLPLPGTPDLGQLDARLQAKGLELGAPLFLRVFKSESLLEVWMQKDERFVLLDTYPICHWSGTLGPKVKEGDRQNPEGFYSFTQRLLHRSGKHPRSLNLGFPNSFDRSLDRTGSYILVHGGCSSVGCFAMTDPVMDEIFLLARASLRRGQDRVHVHVFPFRMTQDNLDAYSTSPWAAFWANLKEGYDAFEASHLPPRVGVCDKRYVVETALPGEGGDQGPLALCGALSAVADLNLPSFAELAPRWSPPPSLASGLPSRPGASGSDEARSKASPTEVAARAPESLASGSRPTSARGGKSTSRTVAKVQATCNTALASCRLFIANKQRAAALRTKSRNTVASAGATRSR